jgi:hypothetical protein
MTDYSSPTSSTPTSTLAIVSLIAGVTGWTIFPLLGSIVAVITGHLAKNEIRNSAGALQGDGFATVGLILGYLSLALGVCLCLVLVLIFLGLVPLAAYRSALPAFSLLFA